MSDSFCQPSLFYHLGVRESFSMTNNIILYCSKQDSDLQAHKVTLAPIYCYILFIVYSLMCWKWKIVQQALLYYCNYGGIFS